MLTGWKSAAGGWGSGCTVVVVGVVGVGIPMPAGSTLYMVGGGIPGTGGVENLCIQIL